MVVQKLIQLKNIDTRLTICPIVRESNGLAMSSRNIRLSNEGWNLAIAIYQSLLFVKENITSVLIESIEKQVAHNLLTNGFSSIDYVAICNGDTLESLSHYSPQTPIVVLIAAFIDEVRLIDNMLIS
jgi:pantoate--beta-alanine ligase